MGMKNNKKSKTGSKRITLKQKSKVMRKIKEHHKKKAKEAKKVVVYKKQKVDKDSAIANDQPLSEEELKALAERRARALEEFERKKAAGKERVQKRKLGELDDDDEASPKQKKAKEGKGNDDSFKVVKVRENSERAFYKELTKVIEASDVILEVLDARDPLGTRCADMEKMVMKSGPEKHLVLLLNKIDLAPREAVEKWLKYLREELPAVAFKCSTQEQRSNLGWNKSSSRKAKAKPSNLLQTSDCLGAETLLKLLKNYSRSHEIKKSITVGVIGLPNVGKSSLINSLKRCHVANVGATPGLTRSLQEVQLDKNVKLLDCPGVVMLRSGSNDASIALRNCKRIEKLDDPVAPVKEILKICQANLLVTIYKIPTFESVDDFLYNVATVRGKLKKGGIVDIDAAARIVLHDWNEGKIPYYTMPPIRSQDEPSQARIVSELGKEFNIDEVYNDESSFIGTLKSVADLDPVEFPPSCALSFDDKMNEKDEQPEGNKSLEDPPVEGDGDESMGVETDEADKITEKTVPRHQNEKLYRSKGILNPKLKKAEKKRRKKEKLKSSKLASADSIYDDDEGDYDSENDLAMDEGDRKPEKVVPKRPGVGKVPMADVNFDLLDQ